MVVTAEDDDLYPDGLLPIPAKKLADLSALRACSAECDLLNLGTRATPGHKGGGTRRGVRVRHAILPPFNKCTTHPRAPPRVQVEVEGGGRRVRV